MKIKICFFLGLSLFINQVAAQSYLQQFFQLSSKNDTIGELELLNKWESTDNNDPDLYVAWFNYFFQKSMKEVVRMDSDTTKKNGFQITDPATQKRVGSMYGDIYYDPVIVEKGIKYIDKGIKKYPTRLDMRFGKVYAYGKTEDYENFTKEIIKAVDYSDVIKNKWTWKENKPLEDSKKFMLGTIQSYQNQLYNTGNDSLLKNILTIATVVLKYYPDNVESLSNKSVVYLINKKYDKAIDALLTAVKLAPSDYIVLSNLAQAFRLKGDKENALKYYELTLKFGDQQAKEFARKQIEEIKNK
jgi:tetratricopeptide (TPR) repeat protein